MPIRLNKVISKLNVGLSTLVDFLHRKGFEEVEENPNTRIDDDLVKMAIQEFTRDMPSDKVKEIEADLLRTKVAKKSTKEDSAVEKEPNKENEEVIKVEIPEDLKPKVVTKGRIKLDDDKEKSHQSKPMDLEEEVTPDVINEPKLPEEKEEISMIETEITIEQEVIAEPDIDTQHTDELPLSVEMKEESSQEPNPEVIQEETQFVQEITPPKEDNIVPEKKEKEEIIPSIVNDLDTEEKTLEKEDTEMPEITSSDVVETPKDIVPEVEGNPTSVDHPEKTKDENEVFRLGTRDLEPSITIKGKIDLDAINQSRPKKQTKEERREKNKVADTRTGEKKEGEARKRRKRIQKQAVEIRNEGNNRKRDNQKTNANHSSKRKKPIKAEVSDEEVQKQIKETLARLTSKKATSKGAKYRREKRAEADKEQRRQMDLERSDSKVLKLTEFVTANDLANMMDIPVNQVIATCMSIGMMVAINQRLDAETINIVADEFGFKTEYVSADVVEAITSEEDDDDPEKMMDRAPIVTVMGHVDHGKTSLLDFIRSSNVIAGEAGGITQHIGAYNVKLSSGRRITFLDTPGHEAFTAMRARGAKITDVAIIIIAADDAVMPQTIEAINHASAAGVPIVFAINKVDKPHANPEKIKEELAGMNYLVEDWGGKFQSQDISAKKGMGVKELLEKVLLEADLLDLKANPDSRAKGSVIESSLDKGRGYVATILVEKGTLHIGDHILAGTNFGRVKAMFNERNQPITEVRPSEPALILGFNGAPAAGDTFNVLETEQEARVIATRREQLQREQGLRTQKILTLDDIGRRIAIGNFRQLNIIVKGDVDGSVEALSDSLIRLSTEQIQVNVIHKAVGQISESDVVLAAASDAVIIGFQVRPALQARRMAENEGVEIRLYSIIYDAIEDVKAAMEGMLEPEIKEEVTANVEVLETFKISKVGTIAGCMVKDGKIRRNNKIRLVRDGIVIYSGELESLKRFKEDVKEVSSGYECGLNIANYNDIKVGDIIEAYEEIEVKQTL